MANPLWKQAMADTAGFREYKRNLLLSALAAIAQFVVSPMLGKKAEDVVQDFLISAVLLIVLFLLIPVAEFIVRLVQAPKKLLLARIAELEATVKQQAATLNSVGAPSVDLLIRAPHVFEFHNRGGGNISLYGTRVGRGPFAMDIPRIITPDQTYHIEGEEILARWRNELSLRTGAEEQKAGLRENLKAFISTTNGKRYVNDFHIWVRLRGTELIIKTQNLGAEEIAEFPNDTRQLGD